MRAFVCMSSSQKDISRAVAWVSGGFSIGQSCGPIIQLVFIPLGFPGVRLIGPFYIRYKLLDIIRITFSIYTAPAYFSCLINVACLACLWILFDEKYAGLANTCNNDEKSTSVPKYDLLALLLCHLTIFSQRLTFSTLETLNSPISMLMFGWNKTEVIRLVGLAHAAVSIIGLFVSIFYVLFNMERIVNHRIQCICSILGLLLFHVLTFSYPFYPNEVSTYTQEVK